MSSARWRHWALLRPRALRVGAAMARRERTQVTVRRAAQRLPASQEQVAMLNCSKRCDAHEHGGRMREGWAARGERCAANSARAEAAPHQAPTAAGLCGCEGAIGAAPMVESGVCRTRFATSALRGGARLISARNPCAKSSRARSVGAPVGLTDLTLSCAAGSACRSRSGAPVAANNVRRTEWRAATGVTPSRWL